VVVKNVLVVSPSDTITASGFLPNPSPRLPARNVTRPRAVSRPMILPSSVMIGLRSRADRACAVAVAGEARKTPLRDAPSLTLATKARRSLESSDAVGLSDVKRSPVPLAPDSPTSTSGVTPPSVAR
jgi:hypothetical protein